MIQSQEDSEVIVTQLILLIDSKNILYLIHISKEEKLLNIYSKMSRDCSISPLKDSERIASTELLKSFFKTRSPRFVISVLVEKLVFSSVKMDQHILLQALIILQYEFVFCINTKKRN